MAKQEFSLFRTLADHCKNGNNGKNRWVGASQEKPLRGILAWKYKNIRKVNARPNVKTLRMETLTDEGLEEWLRSPDPRPPANAVALEAHVQVLVCHQTEINIHAPNSAAQKRSYHMARSSFDAAEKHLRLPVQTLPTMASLWGTQSSEFIIDTNEAERESTCLDITMSNANIPELARYGLAMSYDFSTRRTTAFVKGTNAVDKDSGSTYQPWKIDDWIRKSLRDSMPLWSHPLLLPVIMLQHELAAIRNFSRARLHTDSSDIQATMRLDYEDQAKLLGGRNSNKKGREERAQFTNGLNSLLCSAHSIHRGLRVARQAAGFLFGVLDELRDRKLAPGEEAIPPQVGQQIKDTLMTLDRGAAGFEAGVDSIIATLEVQLNILSVVASQLDNNRSAQMSAQAGLDSVAMKTLALVTAIFLPATFIATLFSMSMFDWQEGRVSPGFWIFWAVSVPLSLAVLGAWWCFWDLSRSHYKTKFQDADATREHETLWKTLKDKMRPHGHFNVDNETERVEEPDIANDTWIVNNKASLYYHLNKPVGRRPKRSSEEDSMESGGLDTRQQE